MSKYEKIGQTQTDIH